MLLTEKEQATRVYAAERSCSWWHKQPITLSDAKYAATEMRKSLVWQTTFFNVQSELSIECTLRRKRRLFDGQFRSNTNKEDQRLLFEPEGMYYGVLMHEMAHYVTWNVANLMTHGANFVWFYTHMVQDFMNRESALELVDEMHRCGVTFPPGAK